MHESQPSPWRYSPERSRQMRNNDRKNRSTGDPALKSNSKDHGVRPAALHSVSKCNGEDHSANVRVRTGNLHRTHPVASNKSSLADRVRDEDRVQDKTRNSKVSNSNPHRAECRSVKDKAELNSKVVNSSSSALRGRHRFGVGLNSRQNNSRPNSANRFKRCANRFCNDMTVMAMDASQNRNEKPLNAR